MSSHPKKKRPTAAASSRNRKGKKRINLAVVTAIGLVALIIGGIVAAVVTRDGGDDDLSPPELSRYGSDTSKVDPYLDKVGAQLRKRSVYVDPAVIDDGALSDGQVAELERKAADAPGPLRIAVLPVERLEAPFDDDGIEYESPPLNLAYEPSEMLSVIGQKVGKPGTYALIIHAGSPDKGRTMVAHPYLGAETEDSDVDGVNNALKEVHDCCTPDYHDMLARFIDVSDERPLGGWAIFGLVVGGLAAAVGLLYWSARGLGYSFYWPESRSGGGGHSDHHQTSVYTSSSDSGSSGSDSGGGFSF
ncbi:MAG TPA: hypothetical protein VE172_11660 [Stackebrandtia sp.]|jgi:hypothetical protein|uniref:hypothetical protein n=1 Tax=Stackebrandtia sp. TaxID=2023065 RepID=UPI002D4460AC|nr:hypothetical protein [Stackebrandtia sp.]HZE39454.1 hypothetical protein [Stackebrandtia sp.]